MAEVPRIYMDSCCFIDLVKLGRKRPLASHPDEDRARRNDCWYLGKLCDASRDGAIRIVTSVLSIGECLHIGDDAPVDEETQTLFDAFLSSGRVVDLVEADVFITEQARALRWKHDIRLGGADGIHIATAIDRSCSEFITTDGQIRGQTKLSKAIPALGSLGLLVISGSKTGLLPSEYLIDDLFLTKT